MTQFECSLLALEHLLDRVGSEEKRSVVNKQISAWRRRRDADLSGGSVPGLSQASDWIIHAQNGDDVTPIQQVWANLLMDKLLYVIAEVRGNPDDPVLNQKALNAVTAHRSLLVAEFFPARPSARRKPPPSRALHTVHCRACDMTTCSTARLEEFVAGDVMGDYLHEAYANGTLNKLADDVIDGKLNQLAAIRTLAVDIMGNSGIVVSESDAKSTGCSLCGSDTTSVLFWILERKQDLAFSQVSYLSDANNVENGPANDKPETGMQAVSARLWGLALAIVALVVWKWQFQSFVARDLAGVSGSLRANWGMLLLLGMPAVLMFIAALQVISGRSITSWVTEKGRQPLASQWATILAALCATAVAALVASLID